MDKVPGGDGVFQLIDTIGSRVSRNRTISHRRMHGKDKTQGWPAKRASVRRNGSI